MLVTKFHIYLGLLCQLYTIPPRPCSCLGRDGRSSRILDTSILPILVTKFHIYLGLLCQLYTIPPRPCSCTNGHIQ
uniref:Candidate secreted effector n=1 Tax=Meloidogyne incognita TaxID=6306 RepID=A0A914L8Y1_MELIC